MPIKRPFWLILSLSLVVALMIMFGFDFTQ